MHVQPPSFPIDSRRIPSYVPLRLLDRCTVCSQSYTSSISFCVYLAFPVSSSCVSCAFRYAFHQVSPPDTQLVRSPMSPRWVLSLPCEFPVYLWWVPGAFSMSSQWVLDEFPVIFWWVPVRSRRVPGVLSMSSWWVPRLFLVCYRWLPYEFPVCSRCIIGELPVSSWWVPGMFSVCSWWVLADHEFPRVFQVCSLRVPGEFPVCS